MFRGDCDRFRSNVRFIDRRIVKRSVTSNTPGSLIYLEKFLLNRNQNLRIKRSILQNFTFYLKQVKDSKYNIHAKQN